MVAEFERQRSRLFQLVRWYDHQQLARGSELRREFEQVNKETRRQIYHRSQIALKERSRLRHILDDDRQLTVTGTAPKAFSPVRTHSDDRKRRAYGCLLSEFKAPMKKVDDDWLRAKCHSSITLTDFQKQREQERFAVKKIIPPPSEQRRRIKTIMDRCISDLEHSDGVGYDHFLQTSEPNRNAQILAQQLIDEKKQNKNKQKQQ